MSKTGSGIEKRDNSIRIKFILNGETIRETFKLNGVPLRPTAPNLRFATSQAAAIRDDIRLGRFEFSKYFPDSPRAAKETPGSFGAIADLWLLSKGELVEATASQYRNAIGIWKELLGPNTPMDQLTYQVLAAKIGGRKWASAKSLNNYLIPLRGVFEFEYAGARQSANPMLMIKNRSAVKKIPDPLTPDERDNILADMDARLDPRVAAYFRFAFYTGMRPEEIIALQWSDVDVGNGTIRVRRVRTFGTERDGSKTHAERDVDLVGPALDALRVMKRYTFLKPGADIFERPAWHPGKGSKGGKPTPEGPWNSARSQSEVYWTPTLRKLGIRHRPAYNTRHTFATAALMKGVPPEYIASQLGHANSKMLHEKYAKWINGADKGAARRALEEALNPGISPRKVPKSL